MKSRLLKRTIFKSGRDKWCWPNCTEESSQWKRTTFLNSIGASLTGLYSPAVNHSKGVIVCGHPMHPLAKGYYLKSGHAGFLKSAGYDVFLFDFNGFGESDDVSLDFAGDILAAAKEASRISGKKKVGYYGVSFGAAWCICAMKNRHNIESAFLERPFTTLEEFCREDLKSCLILKMLKYLNPKMLNGLNPINHAFDVAGVNRIQLVYAEGDRRTPPVTGEKFLKNFDIENNYKSEQVSWFRLPTVDVDIKILPKSPVRRDKVDADYFNFLADFFDRSLNCIETAH